jgi:chromosome segregation ATPase
MKFHTVVAMLASAMASEVTPVQKVIQLLNGMVEKGKNEKHAEQVQFASYKQWCDDTSVEKQRAIKEGNARIEKLNADIQKAEADAARLGREIAQHDEDISVFQGDVKAATKVREIENTDYLATHKDYSESIDALERAISVLKSQNYDRKQAALLQAANAALMPAKARKAIMAFLSQPSSDPLDVCVPEVNGYEFQL